MAIVNKYTISTAALSSQLEENMCPVTSKASGDTMRFIWSLSFLMLEALLTPKKGNAPKFLDIFGKIVGFSLYIFSISSTILTTIRHIKSQFSSFLTNPLWIIVSTMSLMYSLLISDLAMWYLFSCYLMHLVTFLLYLMTLKSVLLLTHMIKWIPAFNNI